jgi:Asp-tRNA(Asn)/Glu-tRNA(Gln) amidotransferase A subunit family amidase
MDLFDSLEQIETRFNALEPQIMAFVPEEGRFERLYREAEVLSARFQDRETRLPLFGLVVGVKDNLHVAGLVTQVGSRLPPEAFQGDEAECISRMKEAGALILGKTVTTEFHYFTPGPTRNPHHPEHTPGGSSSGSAAAVGAGICSLAVGTQTIGSIIRPAAFCGVVGLKPTYDRISRHGMIPLSPSLDHVGFFTPDVTRANLLASCIYPDWQPVSNLSKPVLGIPEGRYLKNASREGMACFQNTCRKLESFGIEIRRVEVFEDYPQICDRHHLIVAGEAARVHAAWFEKFAHLYDLKTADLVRRGQMVSDTELFSALEGRDRLRSELTVLMDEHEIDLWISPPALGPAPRGLESTGEPTMNLPWSHAGLPTINLPVGKNKAGLPMGLQVTARWYADEALLTWAEDLEHVLEWTPPFPSPEQISLSYGDHTW